MELTEKDREMIVANPVIGQVYEHFMAAVGRQDVLLQEEARLRTRHAELETRMYLSLLRGEDRPINMSMDYVKNHMALIDARNDLDEAMRQVNHYSLSFRRIVIDLLEGRKPTLPRRLVTTFQVEAAKVLSPERTSDDTLGEGSDEDRIQFLGQQSSGEGAS